MFSLKQGFLPPESSTESYQLLLDFKRDLYNKVLYSEYEEILDYESKLYADLNLYFSEEYAVSKVDLENDTTKILSESNR